MAAITLLYSQPGYIDRQGVGANALDKTMDALRVRANQTVLQGAQFIRKAMPKAGTYKESDYGTGLELPRKSEDSSPMPFATPTPGFTTSISVVNFRLAIQAERSMAEDDMFGVTKKMMSGLLRSGKLAIEYGVADLINNATNATGYDGADGVCLANSGHPYARRETGTWSNIETAAALTYDNFSTARKNLRKRKDENGYVSPIFVKKLVVPPDIEKLAREIKTAELNPSNALNTPNVWRNDGWEVVVYDYMTDTNAWFLVGDRPEDERGLIYVEKVAPSIAALEGADKSTDIIWGTRLRMRVGFGLSVEQNWQYNAGA